MVTVPKAYKSQEAGSGTLPVGLLLVVIVNSGESVAVAFPKTYSSPIAVDDRFEIRPPIPNSEFESAVMSARAAASSTIVSSMVAFAAV